MVGRVGAVQPVLGQRAIPAIAIVGRLDQRIGKIAQRSFIVCVLET